MVEKKVRWEEHEKFVWDLIEAEHSAVEVSREILEEFDVLGENDYEDIWIQTLTLMKEKGLDRVEIYVETDVWKDTYVHLVRHWRSRPYKIRTEDDWEFVRLRSWDYHNLELEDKLALLRLLMVAKPVSREERII